MKDKGKSRKAKKLSDRALCDIVMEKAGVKKAVIVSTSEVETADWVRLKCQFGCDGYGGSFVCPPLSLPHRSRCDKSLTAIKEPY